MIFIVGRYRWPIYKNSIGLMWVLTVSEKFVLTGKLVITYRPYIHESLD